MGMIILYNSIIFKSQQDDFLKHYWTRFFSFCAGFPGKGILEEILGHSSPGRKLFHFRKGPGRVCGSATFGLLHYLHLSACPRAGGVYKCVYVGGGF
jgi:hypothetical protein